MVITSGVARVAQAIRRLKLINMITNNFFMKKQKFLLLNLVAIAVAVVPAVVKAESTGDLPDKTATFEENTLPAESHWIGDGTPDDMYAGELNDWYSGLQSLQYSLPVLT